MIKVTRINQEEKFWVNENLIEIMEETPDTILSMMSGRKIGVAESAEEIVRSISDANRMILIARGELNGVIE